MHYHHYSYLEHHDKYYCRLFFKYLMDLFCTQIIMIFNWIGYVPLTYGEYVFPDWAQALGWGLASLSLICLPIGMALGVKQSTGKNLWQVSTEMHQFSVDYSSNSS